MSWIFTAVTVVSGLYSMYTQYQQGVATKKYYDAVAEQQRQQAKLDYARGEKQAELDTIQAKYAGKNQKEKAAMVSSSQRAAMVANGIDLSSVTSEDVGSDTWSKAKTDELAIRYNSEMSNWATMEDAKYKRWAGNVNAANSKWQGKAAMYEASTGMVKTLLSTATSLASKGLSSGNTSSGTIAGGKVGSVSMNSNGAGFTESVSRSNNTLYRNITVR